jgi:hypothetical protein
MPTSSSFPIDISLLHNRYRITAVLAVMLTLWQGWEERGKRWQEVLAPLIQPLSRIPTLLSDAGQLLQEPGKYTLALLRSNLDLRYQ